MPLKIDTGNLYSMKVGVETLGPEIQSNSYSPRNFSTGSFENEDKKPSVDGNSLNDLYSVNPLYFIHIRI